MKITRKDLEEVIEPIIEHRDELKKEIEIAEKYRDQSILLMRNNPIELAKQEYETLESVTKEFMKLLIKLDLREIENK